MRSVFGNVLSVGALLLLLGGTPVVSQETTVLKGATLHTISGETIENGVLVMEGRTIVALGDASTAAPAGAQVVELAGKHVYPGFVHPRSTLGLVEIDSIRATVDTTEIGDNNANVRSEVSFLADSIRLPPAVAGGVLTAHVVPAGGLFEGTSAVMRLEGWNWEEMVLRSPTAMHMVFPDTGSSDDDGATSKNLERIEEILDLARDYRRGRDAGRKLDSDTAYERLGAVLTGEIPLWVQARGADQIRKAIEWLEENEFEDFVIVSNYEAVYVADLLAEKDIPLVIGPVLAQPTRDSESYDFAYAAPARLLQAGVRFVFTDAGDSSFARNLPFEAAMAVAFGMPREAALRAITLGSAEVLGVDDLVGSLDVGKEATLFVSDGDPLEIETDIERVWIAGSEIDLEDDHQRRLWRKYSSRPSSSP